MAGRWRGVRRSQPVVPGRRTDASSAEPEAREPVLAWVGRDIPTPAGEALDALAASVFAGPEGRARVEPLFARYTEQVGVLAADDADFDLLQVYRTDWALCDVPASADAGPGESWAWRAQRGEVPGIELHPLASAAARCITGLFEVYPGEPTWIRDRISGLVVRLFDRVGPFEVEYEGEPVALWELRLMPDESGGFHLARPPLDYPLDLIETLDEELARRFDAQPWPAMQDLRRARLRHLRAGARTPMGRMLRWR